MSAATSVLILGGTHDALDLATRLHERSHVKPILSLAGRTERPELPPGDVRVGHFGGVDGLVAFLGEREIRAVVDATHPYAAEMSVHAARACRERGVPLVALVRAEWSPVAGDRWFPAPDIDSAVPLACALGRRIFLTVGGRSLAPFAVRGDRWFLIRSIDPPHEPLPARCDVILKRGPFALADELALLHANAIDVVVSKQSGGLATYAKIAAARALGLPVVMIERPPRPDVPGVASIEAALLWLEDRVLVTVGGLR